MNENPYQAPADVENVAPHRDEPINLTAFDWPWMISVVIAVGIFAGMAIAFTF